MERRLMVRASLSARALTVLALKTRETASQGCPGSTGETVKSLNGLLIDDTKQYLFYTKCIYLKLLSTDVCPSTKTFVLFQSSPHGVLGFWGFGVFVII